MRRLTFLLLACAFWLPAAESAADAAEALLKRALALAAANQLEEAQRLLKEGRSTYPRDARWAVELAGIAWRQTQPGQAKAFLREGLRLDPANPYANEFLGSVYLLDGNVFAALQYLNRVRTPVIGRLAFAPPPPLRPEILERLAAVSPGQLLTVARLAETEHNLERLRIFGEPRFELAPGRDRESDLTVRAPTLSQPLSGAAGRLLPLLRGLPYQSVALDWLNLGQRAISLTTLGRWDPDKRRIAVGYRAPGIRSAYALSADLRDENWQLAAAGAVKVRSATVGGQVEFELGGGQRWTPGMFVSRHTFRGGERDGETSEALFRNATVWEMRNRFDLPRWRNAERRVTVDAAVTGRTGRVFSRESSRLLGADFDANLRWLPQAKDDLYQVRGRVRAAALAGDLPVDMLYATAIERDNDVWLRGHAGTQNGRKGNAPMGTRFAVAQTGITRRVWRMPLVRVDAGPFLDWGNIGGVAGLGSRGWLYDTGIQTDITVLGGFRMSVLYGRDLRTGHNVFYTTAILR